MANFQIITYTITASSDNTAWGTVTGGGEYDHGTTCVLHATPVTGYGFQEWKKNGTTISINPNYSFTVYESATYVAYFSIYSYTLTVSANPTAGGTVTGNGTFDYGTNCTLTATANAGYTFQNWTKNGEVVSTSPSFNVTVTENAAYVANFQLNSYAITASANPTEGGTVTGGGTFDYGTNCTLTATANTGYTFQNWTKNGEVVSTSANYSFTVTEAANFVANFQLNSYTITANASPAAGGTVTGGGSYHHGDNCTLTATVNSGYTFLNWTKGGEVVSTTPSFSITVTENATYVANFQINSFTITASANPSAGGTVTGAGNYNHGAHCTLTATANAGYTFINWTKNGVAVSTNTSYSFTVTSAANFVANFQISVFEITANTDPDNTGDIEGTGLYNYGETCMLTVTPHEDYRFVNWTLDGQVVSETESFSFVVTEARNYVAHLELVNGINEQGGLTVSLFPNPAKNKLTIEASEPVNVLEIYTLNGALVYRQNNCSERIEINVNNYAIGTYMIRLTTDSTVEIRRFVKE